MSRTFLLILATMLPGVVTLDRELQAQEFSSGIPVLFPSEDEIIARGQSPQTGSPYFTNEPGGSAPAVNFNQPPASSTGTGTLFGNGSRMDLAQSSPYFGQPSPTYPAPINDPFSNGGAVQPPITYRGVNGPSPVRYGWQQRLDFTFLPSQDVHVPGGGSLEALGVDFEAIQTIPLFNSWTFSWGPQISYRSFQGPHTVPDLGPGFDPPNFVDLPGGVYRAGLDLMLRTPTVGGWTLELGFDPSIASDFRSSIDSDSFIFDAHAVAFWNINPQWTLALGALYWDRVDDIILPYAGAIWTPNDIWEFRLIFPKPRVSVFLGTPLGIPTWVYVGGEYHVESYQVKPKSFPDSTQVQMADWRVTGGFRWETGWVSTFAEAGYVFNRETKYKNHGQHFEVTDGVMGRIGFRY